MCLNDKAYQKSEVPISYSARCHIEPTLQTLLAVCRRAHKMGSAQHAGRTSET